jgi:Trypsin-like peptidase domain
MTNIDQFTVAAIPIEQFFNNTYLGHATGFLWRLADTYFLVTNWHVVSAKDFFTGHNLNKTAARPNRLRALFQVAGRFEKQQWDIDIRSKDDEPLWFIHPGRRVDIAVIPFQPIQTDLVIGLYPLNELGNAELRTAIGMDVFILGYPFRITPPAFPIWKRGSIASEPEIVRMTTGYMHVDTATRPGMSGAPVIQRTWGTHLMSNGGTIVDGADRTKFLGVYTGRIPTDHPDESQIGLVWDASYIDEIIAGNIRDK